MIQREYQFKFFLNASHSMDINGKAGQKHSHTWEIVITVEQKEEGDFIQFNAVEKNITAFLSGYQDKYLNEVPPFDKISPNQENLMDYFTEEIDKYMEHSGWTLLKTEISENPMHSYMIVKKETVEVEEEVLEACEQPDISEENDEAAVTKEPGLLDMALDKIKQYDIDMQLFSKAAGITGAVLIGMACCLKRGKK